MSGSSAEGAAWRRMQADGEEIADLTRSGVRIERPADLLEVYAGGADRIILGEDQLHPDFFDLSTGFAGELVQKVINYGMRVAVVAGDHQQRSVSFRQFADETSRGNRFVFVTSVEAAVQRLSGT